MSGELNKIDFARAKARFASEARILTVPTDRYSARVWTWGDGPDLFMIHGMSDRSDSFLLPASELSRQFRCIGFDLPGVQPKDGARLFRYRHDHLVDDSVQILDALGSRSTVVLGASFGSTIAQKLLHRHPDRFPVGILQGGFAHRPIGWKNCLMAFAGRFLPHRPMLSFKGYPKIIRKVHGHGFENREPEVWDWFLQCVGNTSLPTMAHQAYMISGIDNRPLLKSITQPVLLITGDLDTTIDHRASAPLIEGLPAGVHEPMANCGHVPCYTHPEHLVDIIQRFTRNISLPPIQQKVPPSP